MMRNVYHTYRSTIRKTSLIESQLKEDATLAVAVAVDEADKYVAVASSAAVEVAASMLVVFKWIRVWWKCVDESVLMKVC
jgi:negative regulator of sigma E activity